jgi:hypothetical protein
MTSPAPQKDSSPILIVGKKELTEFKGMTFRDLVIVKQPLVEGTVTLGDKKLVLKGIFSIVETKKSWKWGPQIEFKLWAEEVEEQVRCDQGKEGGKTRLQIYLPLKLGLEVLHHAYHRLLGGEILSEDEGEDPPTKVEAFI